MVDQVEIVKGGWLYALLRWSHCWCD